MFAHWHDMLGSFFINNFFVALACRYLLDVHEALLESQRQRWDRSLHDALARDTALPCKLLFRGLRTRRSGLVRVVVVQAEKVALLVLALFVPRHLSRALPLGVMVGVLGAGLVLALRTRVHLDVAEGWLDVLCR